MEKKLFNAETKKYESARYILQRLNIISLLICSE